MSYEKLIECKNKLKKTLPFKCACRFMHTVRKNSEISAGFFDIRSYYKNLKFYPIMITKEFLLKHDIVIEERFLNSCALIALISDNINDSDYDVFYNLYESCDIEKIDSSANKIKFTEASDAYFDIRIYNATYAKLVLYSSYSKISEIDMDFVDGYFTFIDITLDNPLFRTSGGNNLFILTDGNYYSYKVIYLDIVSRHIVSTLNDYSVSWFPSKNLTLFCCSWHPCYIDYSDNILDAPYIE